MHSSAPPHLPRLHVQLGGNRLSGTVPDAWASAPQVSAGVQLATSWLAPPVSHSVACLCRHRLLLCSFLALPCMPCQAGCPCLPPERSPPSLMHAAVSAEPRKQLTHRAGLPRRRAASDQGQDSAARACRVRCVRQRCAVGDPACRAPLAVPYHPVSAASPLPCLPACMHACRMHATPAACGASAGGVVPCTREFVAPTPRGAATWRTPT